MKYDLFLRKQIAKVRKQQRLVIREDNRNAKLGIQDDDIIYERHRLCREYWTLALCLTIFRTAKKKGNL